MIFDTDILIWVQRGNKAAARAIEKTENRAVSAMTYMELLQGAKDKTQLSYGRQFLTNQQFAILPLTENIGHRASVYLEQYALSHHMRAGDALIAATASEHGLTLVTANAKHYRFIPALKLKTVRVS